MGKYAGLAWVQVFPGGGGVNFERVEKVEGMEEQMLYTYSHLGNTWHQLEWII